MKLAHRLRLWWARRWIVASLVGILAVLGYLVALSSTENDRTRAQVDKIRQPVCAIMYTALSRPPSQSTQIQLEARREYLKAYGPTGLNCPRPLPDEAKIPA